MAQTAVSTDTAVNTAGGKETLAVAAAIALAILFVAAMFLVVPYDTGADDATLLADLDDAKAMMLVGIYAGVLSSIAFLVVATTFIRRLAAGLSDRELPVARGAAILGTVGIALGTGIAGSAGPAQLFGDSDQEVSAQLARFIPHVGFVTLMIVGALGIALFLALLARAAHRTGLLPGWFTVVTWVTVVAMILAPMFITLVLLPVWAIAAAIVLARPAAAAA